MLLLWLSNNNPAYQPFVELFDDAELEHTVYDDMIAGLETFFEGEPGFGGEQESLAVDAAQPGAQNAALVSCAA